MKYNRLALVVPVAMAISCILTACNTTAGVGKDVKSVGGTLESTAEKAKK